MALLDIFKKKKKKKEKKKKEVSVAKAPEKKQNESRIEIQQPRKKVIGGGYQILYSPHITEKATKLSNENKYIFKVWPKAKKPEIKKAIEGQYGVNVNRVRIVRIPGKQRRIGRKMGWKKGYKKAIIEIKEGQKIEILPK